MTFPLGRFGDSRVTPDELFDATDPAARPPYGAIDVQFRVPVTLNTLLHMMTETGNDDLLDVWHRIYTEVVDGTVLFVQRSARGVDVERSGLAPARLAITPVIHGEIEGFAYPRWHAHVYVGAMATSLLDGQLIPVHLEALRSAVGGVAYPFYVEKLEGLTNAEWGVQWGEPGDWEVREIVAPEVHEFVDSRDRGVCSMGQPADLQDVILPDQFDLEFAEQGECVAARARAEGRPQPGSYQRPKLMFEDEDVPAPS